MRISLFIPDFEEGGAQKMMINLAGALVQNANIYVDLVVACSNGSFKNLVSKDVNIIQLECSRTFQAIPKLARYIKTVKPDVLVSALYHANVVTLMAKLLTTSQNKHTKFIITERNHLSTKIKNSSSIKDKILLRAIKILYPKADALIAISKGVMKDVLSLCPSVENKTSYIYNPVITSSFEQEINTSSVSELLVPNSKLPIIIASGRLVEQKDYPTMLRAIALVIKEKPVNLVILGKGPLHDELTSLTKELSISEHVFFKGFVKNPLAYMKQADMFLMTSGWEGFGNVLVEALYCGLPIVATDCPSGPAEIIANGRYGNLTKIGDEHKISQAILDTLEHPMPREKQRQRAMEFTAEAISKQYLQRIKDLIK